MWSCVSCVQYLGFGSIIVKGRVDVLGLYKTERYNYIALLALCPLCCSADSCLGRCFCSTVVSFWQNRRSKINYTVTRAQPNAPSHVVLVLPYQIFSLRTLFARDKYKKMALCTFHDIPNTILGDIFAHFDFNSNWFYRR